MMTGKKTKAARGKVSMKARELILVNWGLIPDNAYALPDIGAFTGDTGAGKTSILDAVVAVMTGASSRIGRFNNASDDGRGTRHRNVVYRTLQSYILGAQDQSYARPGGAHGYAVMTFEPAATEKAQPFSAIIGASAVIGEIDSGSTKIREPRLNGKPHLIVVSGESINIADLLVSRVDGMRQPIAPEKLAEELRRTYTNAKVIHFGEEHMRYLQKVYGMFRGRDEVGRQEAETAATAFTKFISQEQIEDISKFVRDFVLSEPEYFQELEDIASNMRKSKRLKEQATSMRKRLEMLELAIKHGHSFTEQVVRAKIMEEAGIRREKEDAKAAGARIRRSLTEHARKARDAKVQLDEIELQISRDEELKIQVVAQLRGIPAYQQRGDLQINIGALRVQIGGYSTEAKTRAKEISSFISDLPRITGRLDHFKPFRAVDGLLRQAFGGSAVNKAVFDALQDASGGIPEDGADHDAWEYLREAAVDAEAIVGSFGKVLCGPDRVLNSEIAAAIQSQNQKIEEINAKITALSDEVNLIRRSSTIQYPKDTEKALLAIRINMPEAEPAVLCDLITEVRDPSWQPAIEGYIGGVRFNIIVKPDAERAVNALLVRSDLRRGATVVQSGRAMKDAAKLTVETESIVRELKVENTYAEAFLKVRFGRTIKVDRVDQIHNISNGVTKDGRGSRGYATFNCLADDDDLTFGVQARQKRLQARQAQIDVLTAEREKIEAAKQMLVLLKRFESGLNQITRDNLSDICSKAVDAASQITNFESQIKSIDISDAADLEKKLKEINKTVDESKNRRSELLNVRSQNVVKVETYSNQLEDNEKTMEGADARIEQAQVELTHLKANAYWVNSEKIQAEADALVIDVGSSVLGIRELARKSLSQLHEIRGRFTATVNEFNILAISDEEKFNITHLIIQGDRDIDPESVEAFMVMADLIIGLEKQTFSLRNNNLTKLEAEIGSIADTIKQTFSTHFCTKIAAEIDNAKLSIQALNMELVGHKFGDDLFEFGEEWSTRDFRDRYGLFESVAKASAQENFDMFADGALESDYARVRDEIFGLFLSTEDDSRRRLLQIADYRNYKTYDLFKVMKSGTETKKISLSKQLTGSGGEKETGLFVARVATIAGAFRLRQSGPHLCTVVIDELFKKTGEARIRQAIEYLSSTLGLQVIFAMPTRSFGPFKDLVHGEHRLTRVPIATPIGEVNHYVLTEYNAYNQKAVIELRQNKQQAVRQQATLDFEQREAAGAQG